MQEGNSLSSRYHEYHYIIAGPAKTGPSAGKEEEEDDDDDDKVKVRITRIKTGDLLKEGEEVRSKEIEELEKSVQKELEEAGLNSPGLKHCIFTPLVGSLIWGLSSHFHTFEFQCKI